MHQTPTDAAICASLADPTSFPTISCRETTGSTSDDARAVLSEGVPGPVLVTAESQTNGRGRRGNEWASPPGAPLFFSVGMTTRIPPERRSLLSPAAAVCLADSLERICKVPVGVKWPNDLIVRDKKVCGLLLETCNVNDIIIGVGLNLNTDENWFGENDLPLAGSIQIEAKGRTALLAALAESLLEIETRVAAEAALQQAFERRDVLVNRTITCIDGTTPHTGRVHEINLKSGLVLDVDGDLMSFSPHTIRILS